VAGVLEEVAAEIGEQHLVVSVAAGITTGFIGDRLLAEVAAQSPPVVVRAMPNLAAQAGKSMTAICGGSRAGSEHLAAAQRLFSSVGAVIEVEEEQMDAVTAVSGSGPAYFAYVCEAMTKAGEKLGLSAATSRELVVQTLFGTAAMLREQGLDAAELRASVTSPGGTTAAAIGQLDEAGVAEAFIQAIQAAADRAGAISKENSTY